MTDPERPGPDGRLSPDLVQRLRARAADPGRRSDSSGLAAHSTPVGEVLAGRQEELRSRPEEFQRQVVDYLGGVNSPFAGLMGGIAGSHGGAPDLLSALSTLTGGQAVFASGAGGVVSLGGEARLAPAPPPVTEEDLAAAERELGWLLPGPLRHLYAEVADGGVGPGDGVYSLAALLAKHRELTEGPVGPQGQSWPAALLPIQGPDWDLVCLDRDTGRLVLWDLEELDDDEDLPADQPTWSASFVPEADSLEAWLDRWA